MNAFRDFQLVKYEIISVTPEIAAKWLESNTGNRTIKNAKVKEYANTMKRGSWRPGTGDPIRISTGGNLIDGQHRLWAVLTAGIPMNFMVYHLQPTDGKGELTATGVPIDFGSRRTTSDVTGIERKYISIASTLIRDIAQNGQSLIKHPDIIFNVFRDIEDSIVYVCDKCNSAEKTFSQAAIKSIIVLRHAMGSDYTDEYNHVLRSRYNALSNGWNSWLLRIRDIPKHDMPSRKLMMIYTWAVTDPTRDHEKGRLSVRNFETHVQEIRGSFYAICGPSLRGFA
jgi:hypothetical protein